MQREEHVRGSNRLSVAPLQSGSQAIANRSPIGGELAVGEGRYLLEQRRFRPAPRIDVDERLEGQASGLLLNRGRIGSEEERIEISRIRSEVEA